MAAEVEMQDLQEKLTKKGWNITSEGITICIKAFGQTKCTAENVAKFAVDFDLKEIGSKVFTEDVKRGQAESVEGPIVLQIQKVRNISAPKANEESSTAPRLLKIQLTDGHATCSALENDHIQQLSLSTPPGTKIRLKGTIPLWSGFLMLEPGRIEIVGGKVEKMLAKWEADRSITQQTMRSGVDSEGPPAYTPFEAKSSVSLKREPDKEKISKRLQESLTTSDGKSNSNNEHNTNKTNENRNYNKNQRNQIAKHDEKGKRTEDDGIKLSKQGDKVRGDFNRRQGQSFEQQKGAEQRRPFTSTGSDQIRQKQSDQIRPNQSDQIREKQSDQIRENQSDQIRQNQSMQGRKQATFQNRSDSGRHSDNGQGNMPRKREIEDGRWTGRNDGKKGVGEKHDRRKNYRGGSRNDEEDYHGDAESGARAPQGTLWDFLESKFPMKETKNENKVPAQDFHDRPAEENKSRYNEQWGGNKMEDRDTDASAHDDVCSSGGDKGGKRQITAPARGRNDEPKSGTNYGNRQNYEREVQKNGVKVNNTLDDLRERQDSPKTGKRGQGSVGTETGINRDTRKVEKSYCNPTNPPVREKQEPSNGRQYNSINVRNNSRDRNVGYGRDQDGSRRETSGREKQEQSRGRQNDRKDIKKNVFRNDEGFQREGMEERKRQQGSDGDLRGNTGRENPKQSNKTQNDHVDVKNSERNQERFQKQRGEDKKQQQRFHAGDSARENPNQSNKKQTEKVDAKNASRNEGSFRKERNEDRKQHQGNAADNLREPFGPEKQNQLNKKQTEKVEVKNVGRNEGRFRNERNEDNKQHQGSDNNLRVAGAPEKQNQSNKKQTDKLDVKNASRDNEYVRPERSEGERQNQGSMDCNKQFSETKKQEQHVGKTECEKGEMASKKGNYKEASVEGKRASGREQGGSDCNSVAYSSPLNNATAAHIQIPPAGNKRWWNKGDQCMAFCSLDRQYHLARILNVEVRLRSCFVVFPETNTEEMVSWSYISSLDVHHNNYGGQVFSSYPSHVDPSYFQPTPGLYPAHLTSNQWVHYPDGSFQPYFPHQQQNQTVNTRDTAVQNNNSNRQRTPRTTQAFYKPPTRD